MRQQIPGLMHKGDLVSNVRNRAHQMRKRTSSFGAVTPWYPVELPISYEGAERGSLQGDGRTLAISSGAIRFACERDLPIGLVIRLAIQWPAKLGDGTSLSLSAIGKIQRSALCEVEVAIVRHEFRTRRGEPAKALIMINATARAAG